MIFPAPNPRIRHWRGQRVWLIGASSGIGAALAQQLLAQGAQVALSARSEAPLQALADAQPGAIVLPLDVTQPARWQAAHARLLAHWGDGPDCVLFCAAIYRPEHSWTLDSTTTRQTVETNLCGVYYGLEVVLAGLLRQPGRALAIVASVAGYVGLPNAAVYGPTKAALNNLAELLYAELHPRGLGVYLINPGFVKTRLTARNDFPMPALQSPEQAAAAILRGMARGQFEISFPKRFTGWLLLLKHLPQRLRLAIVTRTLKS